MEYKASLDSATRTITAGIIIIIVGAIICIYFGLLKTHIGRTIRLTGVAGVILPVIALVVSYFYAPLKYITTDDALIIHRLIGDKVIKIADISEIRLIDSSDLSGTIRTFGVGGFFGNYGKFYNSKMGSMTWYVTQRRNRILIRTSAGKKIIISPDDASLIDRIEDKRNGNT